MNGALNKKLGTLVAEFDPLVIRVDTLRELGYCVSGIKKFYANHNLDFKQLLDSGTPIAAFTKVDDGFLTRAIKAQRAKDNP